MLGEIVMLAYARFIIGENGKVLKAVEDSLYHSDEQTKDFLRECLEYNALETIEERFSDSEVLIIFHPESVQCNHPLDPIEYDTELAIDYIYTLQPNYKEYYKKNIEHWVEVYRGCKSPITEIEDAIGEWEELYNEDFYHKTA
ncbi:hypothetical protein ABWK22_02105 [Gottfriedia acidiceleris]|uniref:hypothetical protein n=1 Tax=Gottfriedia acidiceleris TaxID=371036 RepID=UPI003392C967